MSQRPEKQQPQSTSRSVNGNTGLENSKYNLISSLEQETKFLYRTINTYIEDARRENLIDLKEVWETIKEDKKKHVKMFREALSKDAKEEN